MSRLGRLAKRSLGRLLWVETYRCLRLSWERARVAPAEPPLPLEVRRLERPELARYASVADYEISPRFLEGIAARDDLCFGAFADGKLVSYRFFALQPTAIDAHLRFHFPSRWVYAYKAFTLPGWRGKQLHRQLFLRSVPQVARWVDGLREPLGFVTLVVSDNLSSARALERLGFSPWQSFSVLRVRGRPRLVSPAREKTAEFSIELAQHDQPT